MKLLPKILLAMASPWTSRKLWMTILGVFVVQSLYWVSVWYLYSFVEQWRGELFYKMFASTAWTISMMMLGYLGLQTLAQGWTNTTASATTSVISTILEHKDINITEKVDANIVKKYAEKYKDDPSYRPLNTVPDMNAEDFR